MSRGGGDSSLITHHSLRRPGYQARLVRIGQVGVAGHDAHAVAVQAAGAAGDGAEVGVDPVRRVAGGSSYLIPRVRLSYSPISHPIVGHGPICSPLFGYTLIPGYDHLYR